MIETSKDLFWLIFSISIGALTIFTCFGLYYLIMILRNANKMTTSIREKMELVDKILNLVKDKVEKSSSHLSLIADSAIKLVSFLIDHQKEVKKKKK